MDELSGFQNQDRRAIAITVRNRSSSRIVSIHYRAFIGQDNRRDGGCMETPRGINIVTRRIISAWMPSSLTRIQITLEL